MGRRFRDALARFTGYGQCGRCRRPWFHDGREHRTEYQPWRSCFPLCEECWSSLSREERLPFYEALWSSWFINARDADDARQIWARWALIERAVLAGQ